VSAKIPLEELPDEVLKKLGLAVPSDKPCPKPMVKPQVIAIGGVLLALKGLTNREGLWVLRTCHLLLRSYGKPRKDNTETTPARKPRTIDK